MLSSLGRQGYRLWPQLAHRYFSVSLAPRTSNAGPGATGDKNSLLHSIVEQDWADDAKIHSDGEDSAISPLRQAYPALPSCSELRDGIQHALEDINAISVPLHRSSSPADGFFDPESSLAGLKSDNVFLDAAPSRREECGTLVLPEALVVELETISSLLETKYEDGLLEKLWAILQNNHLLAALPSTTFVEILRRLDPEDEFSPFRLSYSERIPKHYHMLKGHVHYHLDTLKRRRDMYMDICQRRVRTKGNLRIREYAQLLKCARATYDARTASMVMKTMLLKNLRPNLVCYNSFFEAICWSDAWFPHERQFLRVIPFTMRMRGGGGKGHVGPGMDIVPYSVGPRGLKKELTDMFTHMIESGTQADSEAFGHLITALAREGDIENVRAVLRSAWNVDVETIGTLMEDGSVLAPDSPLYPNENTLFIIAHSFGVNNDVSTALHVINFMSRKFSIPIPSAVWAELLEWTYTLSTRRYKRRRVDGAQLGQLPMRSTKDLWDLCVGKPYYCKPTLPMYDILIRSMRRRHILTLMLHYIHEALEKLYAEKQEDCTRGGVLHGGCGREGNGSCQAQTESDFVSFAYIHNWFLLLLSGPRFFPSLAHSDIRFWYRELLPDIVGIFWRYRHVFGVQYNIASGSVELREPSEFASPQLS